MSKKWILLPLCLSSLAFAQAASSPSKPASAPNSASPAVQEISVEGSLDAFNTRLRKLEKEVAILKTGKIAVPLDEPYLSADQLLSWTTNSIVTIYTYSYTNYQDVLKNIRYLFTQDGYDSYVKALESSGNLQMVQEKKWIVTATTTGKARILKEGLADNAHLWEVELPITVNFENATTSFKQNMLLNLQISRVDQNVNAQGVAIQSISAQLQPAESPTESGKTPDEQKGVKDSDNAKDAAAKLIEEEAKKANEQSKKSEPKGKVSNQKGSNTK